MRVASILLLLLSAGVLSAQASIPVTGSISDTDQWALLVSVDFGGAAQSLQLDLAIQATGGTSGLSVVIFDLEELAANGSTNAIVSDFDAGTAVMNLSLVTGTYTGIVDFIVGVTTDSGIGTSPYTGTLGCATLSASAITAAASQVVPLPFFSNEFVHGRILTGNRDAAAQVTYDFGVNYGATPQSITYWLQGSGTTGGTITVSELSSTSTPLTNLTVTDTVSFLEENNGATTTRSGIVRFRITITPAASGTFDWSLCFPQGVAIAPVSDGGGGGGGDEESCSTGESSHFGMLALLASLATARLLQKRIPPKRQSAKAR